MATQNDSGFQSFTTAAAISAHRRVKVDSNGQINLATNDGVAVGYIQHDAASGELATVKLVNAPGTFFAVADTSITRGDAVYASTTGRVTGISTTRMILGYAKIASAANLDVIEVLPPSIQFFP